MLRPNDIRGRLAIGAFTLLVLFAIAIGVSRVVQLDILRNAADSWPFYPRELIPYSKTDRYIALLVPVLHIGAVILFIRWFRRAYYNMHQLSGNLSASEGWAVGAWFIPFVNLVRPVQIMSDMERESRELLEREHLLKTGNGLKRLIFAWWMLWILRMLGSVLLNTFYRNDDRLPSHDMIVKRFQNDLVTVVLDLLSLTAAIAVIHVYAKREKLLPLLAASPTARIQLNDSDLLDD